VRALEKVLGDRGEVRLTADRDAAVSADGLVVPGVGAFAACMAGLARVGAGAIVAERLAAGRPLLGICVGMQVLFESGIEHGVESAGLGVLPGRVEPLRAPVIPHMGWNTVTPPPGTRLFAGIAAGTRFYFVHSYAVAAADSDGSATAGRATRGYLPTVAEHGSRFVAGVEAGLVSATQFHPEKSGKAGQALLANWLDMVADPMLKAHVGQGET
jgi:glutamine amidotransferase